MQRTQAPLIRQAQQKALKIALTGNQRHLKCRRQDPSAAAPLRIGRDDNEVPNQKEDEFHHQSDLTSPAE